MSKTTSINLGVLALAFSKKHDLLQRSLGNLVSYGVLHVALRRIRRPSFVDGEVSREIPCASRMAPQPTHRGIRRNYDRSNASPATSAKHSSEVQSVESQPQFCQRSQQFDGTVCVIVDPRTHARVVRLRREQHEGRVQSPWLCSYGVERGI